MPLLDVQEESPGLLKRRDRLDRALPGPRLRRRRDERAACSTCCRPPQACWWTSPSRCWSARARIAALGGRWQVVARGPRRPSWPAAPRPAIRRGRLGAGDSPSPPERKRELFAEVVRAARAGRHLREHGLRRDRGPLRGLFDEQDARQRRARRARRGGTVTRESSWTTAKTGPTGIEDQLRWLRDAGFEQVEVHFKWAEAAIFGGVKPDERRRSSGTDGDHRRSSQPSRPRRR